MKERRRLCSTALLCAVALLCLWSADAAEAGSRHPQGRFPQQVDQMPASLSENPLTKLVWGEARTHNGTKLHLLHGKCFSSNNQTCSGHGQCKKSGAAVFGTADTNVRRYYCACHPRYFGKACQLTFKDAQDRHLLRNKLLRVLRSARAGKMLETPDGTPRVPDDQGSVFGRMSPDSNGVKIRGRRMRGIIADRFQPTSNSRLEKWAMPNERNLFAGSGMLAQWQRERLSIQIVPDEYLHKKIRLPRRRAKFAFYMNDANGRIIKGPAVSKDQEMPWERDPSMPNPPGVKDPTATPFRTVLNMASPPKPAATAAPSPPAAPTATGAAK